MDRTVIDYKRGNFCGGQPLRELAFYAATLFVAYLLFLTIKPLYYVVYEGFIAQISAAVILLAIGVYAFSLFKKDELSADKAVILLIAAGTVLRLAYMLYTPAAVRQHDTYTKSITGHEAYAYTVFSTGKLPETNDYQFYHPPLNAFLQACLMHFTDWLAGGLDKLFGLNGVIPQGYLAGKPSYTEEYRYFLYTSCQCQAVLYSVVTAVTLVKLIKLFGAEGKTFVALSAFVVFFPRHIQFSAQLNNDALSYMFAALALYFAAKWWKNGRKFTDIMLCSLAVGLGMSAKLSSATVCAPIAVIFIYEFCCSAFRVDGAEKLSKIIVLYACFLLVCAPIGLWFQFYAKAKFGQSFGFVFSNLNRKLYTGDKPFFGRFFIAFDLREYFGWLWCEPFDGQYNLFNYSLRSALFGEFAYGDLEHIVRLVIICTFAIAALLTAFVAALTIFSCEVSSVVLKIKNKEKYNDDDFKLSVFTVALTLSQVLSEIYFYIQMPYGCTMDFRYIMPLIPAIALSFMLFGKRLRTCGIRSIEKLYSVAKFTSFASVAFTTIFYLVCI